jgi:hypothetical protein
MIESSMKKQQQQQHKEPTITPEILALQKGACCC